LQLARGVYYNLAVDYKNSLCENTRGIWRGNYIITENSVEGLLEPEEEIRANDAEGDVKEF
jgi:hypothetical protein